MGHFPEKRNLKAEIISDLIGEMVLADDSGLEAIFLGKPGFIRQDLLAKKLLMKRIMLCC